MRIEMCPAAGISAEVRNRLTFELNLEVHVVVNGCVGEESRCSRKEEIVGKNLNIKSGVKGSIKRDF